LCRKGELERSHPTVKSHNLAREYFLKGHIQMFPGWNYIAGEGYPDIGQRAYTCGTCFLADILQRAVKQSV
jgi:hypothetical protein